MKTVLPRSGILSYGYQRTATHVHQGVDLVAPEGTLIFTPAAGRVRFASAELAQGFSGYGRHVVIETDDGVWLLFAHLDDVDVVPSEPVTRGQLIGTVGRTCFSREDPEKLCSGAHLHFEVSSTPYPKASEAPRLDPVKWLALRNAHPFVQQDVEPSPEPSEPDRGDDEGLDGWFLPVLFAVAGTAAAWFALRGSKL